MHIRRIQATIIVGLLLLMLILPQSALAAGPEISNVQVPDITFTTATITWTTNTTSDSQVHYGSVIPEGPTWEYEPDPPDPDWVTFHSIHLEDLEAGQVYYFEVKSTDGLGTTTDDNGGVYYSFKTLIWYSITLDSACGVCGDLWKPKLCYEVIEATAVVAGVGTYYICWDSCAAWDEATGKGHIPGATFTAGGAGTYTLTFSMPEAAKGDHTVYLTDDTYAEKDSVGFEVRPSVKIYPEEGPVGTEVTLNGYGFDANKAFVVKFKDTVITKSTDKANSVGSWGPLSYTITETPAGGYSFKSGPDADEVWVIEYFEVTPEITITDDDPDDGVYSGTVGQTIEVEGTGFQSEEEDIEVTFDGKEVQTYILPADDNGSWSADIVIPTCQHGEHIIGASGKETSASDVDPVKFIVEAGILVEPDFACVGTPITVKGGGFAAGETGIKVTFDGTVKDSGITAKEDGTWESSFAVPVSTFGSHTVEASGGGITPAVTTTFYTKAKIEKLSLYEGYPGDSVSLTGSGFHGSQELTVTIGGVKVTDSLQTQSNGKFVIPFHVPKGSPEGKQPLMVTDEDGATHEEEVYFTVKEKTLSTTPLPISPKGSTLRSGDVTFKWQGVSGDTGYTYTLEISTSADSGTIWSQPGIEESSYKLTKTETVDETLEKGTYYWRVKMEDDYGNESAWSDSSKFTVSPIPTWVWVVVGVVVLVGLMVVAYRETKFKIT